MQLPLPLSAEERPPHLVRHRRARRYILRVLEDGTVRVTLPRWGSKREALQFLEFNRSWIDEVRRRRPVRDAHPDEARMRRVAKEELPRQLLALAAVHDIAVARVSVRNQKARWGSCSHAGSITLNWRLMLVPDWVREYVMLHELMHRLELNHSRRFWRLVSNVCPRASEAREWLRREGGRLF
jgi:predicted metal-dependent hydrolase